jgi:hypothetical protein
VIVAFAVVACRPPRDGETLIESVRTYNEGIRWSRITAAASRIPPAERPDFVDEWDKLDDELEITDYEVIQVAQQGRRTAEVQVKFTWYLDADGVVHETHALQEWERHGKVWIKVGERRLRGEVMPGIASVEKNPEPALESEPKQ